LNPECRFDRQPAVIDDVAPQECINWRWPGQETPYRWEFRQKGRWIEVAVDGPVITNSREFCINAAVDGLGIALAVKEAVAAYIREGRLVPLLQKWSAPYPGFFLCYPAQRQMPPIVRAFVNHIRTLPR
jgi:DNA-binding transcriptional LysR family regulator